MVAWTEASWQVSQRRACRALGACRSTVRYVSVRPSQAPLRQRMHELASVRVSYGYRRLHVLLRREGWPVNRNGSSWGVVAGVANGGHGKEALANLTVANGGAMECAGWRVPCAAGTCAGARRPTQRRQGHSHEYECDPAIPARARGLPLGRSSSLTADRRRTKTAIACGACAPRGAVRSRPLGFTSR
jgi:hypothetical protein